MKKHASARAPQRLTLPQKRLFFTVRHFCLLLVCLTSVISLSICACNFSNCVQSLFFNFDLENVLRIEALYS